METKTVGEISNDLEAIERAIRVSGYAFRDAGKNEIDAIQRPLLSKARELVAELSKHYASPTLTAN